MLLERRLETIHSVLGHTLYRHYTTILPTIPRGPIPSEYTVKAILLDKNIVNDWAISLPLVQRIMNASVHSSIGVSPAQLLFGNAVTLDRGIFLPQAGANSKSGGPTLTMSEWADKMLTKQAELSEIAQNSQKTNDDYHSQLIWKGSYRVSNQLICAC